MLVMPGMASAITLFIGGGDLLQVSQEIGTAFVADPNIAEIQVPSPDKVLLMGVKSGTTTLYLLDKDGKEIRRETVVVQHNIGEIQRLLHQRFPAQRLELSSAPGSLMISGGVPDAETVEAIMRSLRPYLGENDTLINRLSLNSPTQVYLKVRVTEMNKSVTQKLGVNWAGLTVQGSGLVAGIISGRALLPGDAAQGALVGATEGYTFLGGYTRDNGSIFGLIDILDREGLVTVLAEPNLTAVSGQTASFLAGGEFPVPVNQDSDKVTVEFKPFGVALDFTPTVLADDRISLKVRPEISELDTTSAISVGGLSIPGLRVRRVETTVEMASGQSFAIGGLLQNDLSDIVSKIPGLGSVPVLGKLFSSSDYRNHKSELVVIVTPYLVRPTSPDQLATPLSALRANSDIEDILSQRVHYDPLDGGLPRLTGAAGFVY
ncbi:type II and III secretion system protein family protein [Castellaniella hirudinis]|uniref:type II and III secretion system protein family protein n=1 Tax=Castellaniella hirudinis TaxID=1144617 RepID=UPI0039C39870